MTDAQTLCDIPPTTTGARSPLTRLLAPRSVAVIGASSDATRIGGRVLAQLISTGFAGPVYPVNPSRESVQGLSTVKAVLDLPEGVDCAVIAVDAKSCVRAARDCVTRKVGSAIIISAGFAEAGEEGIELQAELSALSHSSGMRIVGPNCMGLVNVVDQVYMSFGSWFPEKLSPKFNIAVVTQSGGYGSFLLRLCQRKKIGVSHWITTGNECDVEAGELIGAVAQLPQVDAIVVYLEGIRSAENLVDSLEKAHERRIPLVVIKAGSSVAGAAAAASHTASLAGADEVIDAVLKEYGAFRASCTEEAMDVIYALSVKTLPKDARTAVFTVSGGVGVQIADYMSESGLPLAELSRGAQDEIKALVPQAGTRNPVDITAQFLNEPAVVEKALDIVLGREKYGVLFSFLSSVGLLPDLIAPIVKSYGEVNRRHPGCLNVVAIMGLPEVVEELEQQGCLVYEEPRRAVRALAALHGYARASQRPLPDRMARAAGAVRIACGQRFSEAAAKEVLKSIGISVPREVVASNAQEAVRAARNAGFPVALKIVSADIAHKTEVGGVALDLQDAEAVRTSFETMVAEVGLNAPDAKLDGCLVSPMVSGGVECVIGVVRDPVFGQVVMFGLGGVLVELIRDVSFRLAPVDTRQALEMIRETKGARLLEGFRGKAPADIAALANAIVAVSQLGAANPESVLSIELNPVRVFEAGKGVVALDAAIETSVA
jgi:acyl-CoA synthetase (NDP forming)